MVCGLRVWMGFGGLAASSHVSAKILKFFKRTILRRRSPKQEDSLGVLVLRGGCGFWTLKVPRHLIGLVDGSERLYAPFSARQVSGRSRAEGLKHFHEARLGRSVRQTGRARMEVQS